MKQKKEKYRPFGLNLKKYRAQRELTQQSLAGLAGTSQEQICSYENGMAEPPLNIVKNLADALKVDVSLLFDQSVLDEEEEYEKVRVVTASKQKKQNKRKSRPDK